MEAGANKKCSSGFCQLVVAADFESHARFKGRSVQWRVGLRIERTSDTHSQYILANGKKKKLLVGNRTASPPCDDVACWQALCSDQAGKLNYKAVYFTFSCQYKHTARAPVNVC